jgi:hypothetical protein
MQFLLMKHLVAHKFLKSENGGKRQWKRCQNGHDGGTRNKGMEVTMTRWHPRQEQLSEFLRRQIETHIHRIEARKEE